MKKSTQSEIKTETLIVETPKRGRKINPNSVRQMRLAELEAKRSNGECKRGRPVNQDSVRQRRLNEMKSRAELTGGIIKRGRPAKIKEAAVEKEAVVE
jgi:hypothetical protein